MARFAHIKRVLFRVTAPPRARAAKMQGCVELDNKATKKIQKIGATWQVCGPCLSTASAQFLKNFSLLVQSNYGNCETDAPYRIG
jgi:hypothetical protein